MGILIKMINGIPEKQDYEKDDVVTALQNIAGDKPNGKKSQLMFVIEQLKYRDAKGNKNIISILQDIARDIKEAGEYIGTLST